jgi:hypothetical protein
LAAGRWKLADLCRKVFDAIPAGADGIPDAGTGPQVNVRDFGFCDAEQKTGKFLFTAVLRYDAPVADQSQPSPAPPRSGWKNWSRRQAIPPAPIIIGTPRRRLKGTSGRFSTTTAAMRLPSAGRLGKRLRDRGRRGR